VTVETFGHEPVTGFIDGLGLVPVCARCGIPVKPKYAARWPEGLPVRWPCMSAVVLGLDPGVSADDD
jgi:hypothetical protein